MIYFTTPLGNFYNIYEFIYHIDDRGLIYLNYYCIVNNEKKIWGYCPYELIAFYDITNIVNLCLYLDVVYNENNNYSSEPIKIPLKTKRSRRSRRSRQRKRNKTPQNTPTLAPENHVKFSPEYMRRLCQLVPSQVRMYV